MVNFHTTRLTRITMFIVAKCLSRQVTFFYLWFAMKKGLPRWIDLLLPWWSICHDKLEATFFLQFALILHSNLAYFSLLFPSSLFLIFIGLKRFLIFRVFSLFFALLFLLVHAPFVDFELCFYNFNLEKHHQLYH